MNLGTLYVGVRANDKKLKPDLDRAEKKVKKSASGMSSAIGMINFAALGLAATAFAATLVAAFKGSIKAASDLQEVTSKFEVVFADQMKTANKFTDALVNGYAMSTREARQYLSSVQDLLVPMGMQSDSAALLSGEIVKLSADLGSFNNLETAQVMDDIQSALVGNYETMKKYGVVLNATVVQQKALDMQLASTKESLTAAHKAQAAYALMVESSQAAVGDMTRTMEGYANQQKKLNANMEEFKSLLGQEILPLVTETNKVMNTFMGSVNKFLRENDKIVSRTIVSVSKSVDRLAKIRQKGARFLRASGLAVTGAGVAGEEIKDQFGIRDPKVYGPFPIEQPSIGDNTPEDAAKMNGLFLPGDATAHVEAYRQLQAIQQQVIADAQNTDINPLTFESMSDENQFDRSAEIEALQEYHAFVQSLEYEAALERFSISQWLTEQFVGEEGRRNEHIRKIQKKSATMALKDAQVAMAMMGQQNKTAFELHKKYKIAEATISGIDSAVKAWNAGMSVGGPYAPAFAAAYALASLARTTAMISSIQSSQFGGGGGSTSVGGGVSVGSYPGGSSGASSDLPIDEETEERGTLTVIVQGNVIGDEEHIVDLATKISEMVEDRDLRLVASDAKTAEALI